MTYNETPDQKLTHDEWLETLGGFIGPNYKEEFGRVQHKASEYLSGEELLEFNDLLAGAPDGFGTPHEFFCEWMSVKIKMLDRADGGGDYALSENTRLFSDEEKKDKGAENFLNILRGEIEEFFQHTPFGKGGFKPPILICSHWGSEGEYRATWKHPNEDEYADTDFCPPRSCSYVIKNNGKAYLTNHFERLDLNDFKHVMAVATTIIMDIYGPFEVSEATKSRRNDFPEESESTAEPQTPPVGALKKLVAFRKRYGLYIAGACNLTVIILLIVIGINVANPFLSKQGNKNILFALIGSSVLSMCFKTEEN
jgi:hypothetical protein